MRAFHSLTICSLLVLLTSCGGGGNGGSALSPVPSTLDASAQAQGVRGTLKYVAELLPQAFVPSAMMRDGRIAGSQGRDAAVYHRGEIKDFGNYRGETTVALFAVRDVAVGASTSASGGSRALLFADDRIQDLGNLPPGPNGPNVVNAAEVINDRGAIYGFSSFASALGGPQLVRFSRHAPPVPLLPDTTSLLSAFGQVTDINSSGTFSVVSAVSPPLGPAAALGLDVSLTFPFGEHSSAATGINDNDVVTGYIDPVNEFENDFNHWDPFIRDRAGLHILPKLANNDDVQPTGINDKQDVVGTSGCTNNSCATTVFLYTNGRVYDVRQLAPQPFAGSAFTLVPGISNAGSFVIRTSAGSYILERTDEFDDAN